MEPKENLLRSNYCLEIPFLYFIRTAFVLVERIIFLILFQYYRDCYWRLRTSFNKRFLFHFFALDIGENTDCHYDYLKFYSMWEERKESLTETYCNSSKPAPFYSPASLVLIHFHSDAENSYQGFQITYSVVEGEPGCGGVYSGESGTIQSIESGDFNLADCEYRIQQTLASKIEIIFERFDLGEDQCIYNYVEVHEGPDTESPSIGKYCGSRIPAPFISTGNQLTISSRTMTKVNGWKLKYERVCESTYTEESGSFNVSGSSSDCIYQIERPLGNTIILMLKLSLPSFRSFRTIRPRFSPSNGVDRCYLGRLEVRDGDHENATLIGNYCGEKTINITSTHNSLWMKLMLTGIQRTFADKNIITAEYTSVDVGCGGILRNKFGTISPPIADGSYPPSLKCTWVIIAPPQNVIQLTWMTFNVEESYECTYDNVQVFDNNTELGMGGTMGKFCGFKLPPILLSSSNIMTILFTTDITISMDGFLASYTFIPEHNVCGGSYFTSAGVIKSPKYPESYPTNRECTWIIHVKSGQQIMLNVTDFDIESYSGCRYDWLEIR
ncbi:hypothetical protein JTB14_021144 [Gonioctena quinquepunctata]|nr:hypothetical protein JTB14_021144 [Gonioctena quinquepunctata]